MQAIFENFGIYVHVPFCAAPCGYCRFYKRRADEAEQVRYVELLAKEVRRARRTARKRRRHYVLGRGDAVVALGGLD